MSLTSDIKEYALNIGFAKVGITTAEDFTDFEEELLSRGDMYDPWKERFAVGHKPKAIFPEGKSIIVLAYDYARVDFPEKLTEMIGRAYLSRCYLPLEDSVHGARLQLFRNFLEKNGCTCVADGNKLPMRRVAARAGVANFGRNNFSYVDGVGSFVILYGFIVDKELEYDTPTMTNKCPPDCRKCMDACPTKAIYEPFKTNPSKCMGYNNWMRRVEGDENLDTTIPRDIRKDIGIHIHGCDICQQVCPRNRKKIEGKFPSDPFLEILKDKINLTEILEMTDEYYDRWIHPIMYNYIQDKKIFRRNAAIAMGNTKDAAYIPDLERAMSDPEETVRIHAAWALGRIGGEEAKVILRNQLINENSKMVKEEIKYALTPNEGCSVNLF